MVLLCTKAEPGFDIRLCLRVESLKSDRETDALLRLLLNKVNYIQI